MTRRLPVVGVLGSAEEEHAEKAEAVGRWLASERVHLLTGGGKGVMQAVSRAFQAVPNRAGLIVGVVPCGAEPAVPRPGYPNPFVELAILTHLPLTVASGTEPLSRNHINVLSSNVLIALPGGAGTASEVELALRYRRPIAAYLSARSEIPELPEEVPVFAALAEVQDFVRLRLRAAQSACQ
jgi:uncharacterized protein (TIGR00725 family)